jgi:hypothetical protein
MTDRAGMIAVVMVVALSLTMFFIGLVVGQNTGRDVVVQEAKQPEVKLETPTEDVKQSNKEIVDLCFNMISNSLAGLNKSVEEVSKREFPVVKDYGETLEEIRQHEIDMRRLVLDLKTTVVKRCK